MEWRWCKNHDVCIKHPSEQHAHIFIPKCHWISNESNPEEAKANSDSGLRWSSSPSKSPISSRRRITKRAHGACRSTGTAWTGHSMKKDGEEWHWCGKHPNGPYTLCSSTPPGG